MASSPADDEDDAARKFLLEERIFRVDDTLPKLDLDRIVERCIPSKKTLIFYLDNVNLHRNNKGEARSRIDELQTEIDELMVKVDEADLALYDLFPKLNAEVHAVYKEYREEMGGKPKAADDGKRASIGKVSAQPTSTASASSPT